MVHAEGKLKKAEVGFKFESQDCPPFIVTETKKFRDAMELVTEVITEDQLSKLKDRELNREMLLRITAAISMACVGRMKEYEDGEGAMLTKSEIKSVSTKATFTHWDVEWVLTRKKWRSRHYSKPQEPRKETHHFVGISLFLRADDRVAAGVGRQHCSCLCSACSEFSNSVTRIYKIFRFTLNMLTLFEVTNAF